MNIKSPFGMKRENNYNNSENNNSTPPPKNLPPKSDSKNFTNDEKQSQNNKNTPFMGSSPNYFSQTPQNNFYNNNNLNEEDYAKIKLDFDTKIKQYNASSDYISTTSNIFPKDTKTLSQLSIPMSVSIEKNYARNICGNYFPFYSKQTKYDDGSILIQPLPED